MSQYSNNLAVKTSDEEALKKELSVDERFRQVYQCYASNPKILRSLINNQLPPKIDLAVRVHVWNCERCRQLYSDLKGLVGSDQILPQNLHSISESGIADVAIAGIPVPIETQHQAIEEEKKLCPRCEESLPLSDFGACRARQDGLNLYCKQCIRQKIALSRQALRDYKKARGKHNSGVASGHSQVTLDTKTSLSSRRIARLLQKFSPGDRVREAIRCGAHTQKEIVQVTKLPKDEVCDALANLLLWTREIYTKIVRHQRLYFINDDMELLAKAQAAAKKGNRSLNPSFNSEGAPTNQKARKPKSKRRRDKSKRASRMRASGHSNK